jgi:hypothetical protein
LPPPVCCHQKPPEGLCCSLHVRHRTCCGSPPSLLKQPPKCSLCYASLT